MDTVGKGKEDTWSKSSWFQTLSNGTGNSSFLGRGGMETLATKKESLGRKPQRLHTHQILVNKFNKFTGYKLNIGYKFKELIAYFTLIITCPKRKLRKQSHLQYHQKE